MQFRPAALFLIAAATATAQAPTLEPNTPVRVDMRDRTVFRGVLTSQTVDSAFVWTTAAGRNQALAWGSIATVRVERSRSRAAGARKGLLLGTLIGGVAGAGIGLIGLLTESETNPSLVTTSAGMLIWTVSGGISGAFYGVVIGGSIGARQWETVYPSPAAQLP